MTFAAKTRVPEAQTCVEIEKTLARYGASKFAYFTEAGRVMIIFEATERRFPSSCGETR